MPTRDAPELAESGLAAFAVLQGILHDAEEQGLLRESAREAALLAWTAVHGASFLLIDGGLVKLGLKEDVEEVSRRVHENVWLGIGKR